MNPEDMLEAAALCELFADARNYPANMVQAAIEVEKCGMGFVKWDTTNSTFQVLAFFIDSAGDLKKADSVDSIVGSYAIIKNDNPVAKGIVEMDTTRPDEVHYKLK